MLNTAFAFMGHVIPKVRQCNHLITICNQALNQLIAHSGFTRLTLR